MLFGIIDKDHLVWSINEKLKVMKWEREARSEVHRLRRILKQLHCETLEDEAIVMQYFYGDKYKVVVRDGRVCCELPEREKAV